MAKRRHATWFRQEDYDAFRQLLQNGLPETFDEWEQITTKRNAELEAHGWIIDKVIVNPDKFAAWCSQCQVEANNASLGQFTIEAASNGDREQ